MEWSIRGLAQLAGTTSRALRHYDEIGLLPPSSIGGTAPDSAEAQVLAADHVQWLAATPGTPAGM